MQMYVPVWAKFEAVVRIAILSVIADALGIVGMALSAYIMVDEVFLKCGVCTLSPLPFPKWYPAVAGFLWFLAGILLNRTYGRTKLYMIWSAIGIAGIVVLSAISVHYSYFCPYCVSAWIVGMLQMLYFWKAKRLESMASQ